MTLPRASLLAALALAACPARQTPSPPVADNPAPNAPIAPAAPVAQAPVAPPPAPTTAPAPESSMDDQRAAAQGLNRLGTDLYARLRSQAGNLAVAPGSIAIAFGMTEAGARGATLEEMRRVCLLYTSDAADE